MLVSIKTLPSNGFIFVTYSLKFVVDHSGKPEIREGKMDDWMKGMEILAQNPNVYCKM